MKKAKSSFINMFLTLLVVCALAGAALAAVYQATSAPIQQARDNKQEEAIKQVLPPFDELKTEKKALETISIQSLFHKEAGADSLTLYHAFKNGEPVGTAVESFTNKGFGRFPARRQHLQDRCPEPRGDTGAWIQNGGFLLLQPV